MVQVVQIRGRGGVEVIWTKSKRTATFFRETVLNVNQRQMQAGKVLMVTTMTTTLKDNLDKRQMQASTAGEAGTAGYSPGWSRAAS